ncbi:MAG: SH3 domain-containing protein [bacterium]|nr:SH3 domain-containing protein [bacterium]
METKYGFILMDRNEFKKWVMTYPVTRMIDMIQNHHTWLPDYPVFYSDEDHFKRLKGMKDYHVNENGWSDIAQNITTFPDGKIAICRPLEKSPAGIRGKNSTGICIEHLGNFDLGKDEMTEEHRKTILHVNAVLCMRFDLEPDLSTIVYHHWHKDKTCPGSNFFGGNTREAANEYFIPLVITELAGLGSYVAPPETTDTIIRHATVTAWELNIRKGPGSRNQRAGLLYSGNIVSVYEEKNGWARIDKEELWVFARYISTVYYGNVTISQLNVRTGPGADYRQIDSILQGDKVTIYEKENGWYRISHNEKWVSGKYIKIGS